MTNKQPKYKIPSTTIAGKMYGKMCSKMCDNLPCFKLSLFAASYALAATLAMAAAANAGGVDVSKITRGNVSFSQDGNRLVVRASNGSIIEYNRFSIEAGQIMQFIQPSANSRVLNRVTGAELSRIDGSLLSNGIVYLVNPQGIRIGNGALINVGGFYAAAGAMSDNDFIRGNNTFTDLSGKVTNEGMIQAQSVALVGQYVANHGTINVDDGMVAMAAGDTVFLQNGPSPFMVTVNRSAMGADGSGAGTEAAVTNTGTINAGKGRVSMGSGDFYALGMNLSGTIIGKSIAARGGKGSVVAVNGTLDASNNAGKGGDIDVFGDRVGLFGNALVNANGATGGGSVRIGGDYLGSNAANAPQANRTFIGTDARVTANATQSGNGGRVIIWSNEYTGFFGSIEANGAGTGNGVGNGGFVETSSHDNLQAFGRVDAKAALGGKGGMWLMDPANVEIVAGSAGALVAGVFDPGTSPALIGVDQINASLNGGTSVTINTGTPLDGLGGTGIIALTGNILMTAGGSQTLTLNALANINLDGNITASGLGNNLSVVLNAVTGVTMNGNITTRGGSLTINNTGAFAVTQGGVSVLTIGGTTSVQTGAGAITLVGAAANDLNGAVSLRNTGAFNVSITDANGLILGASIVGGNLSVITGSAGIPLSASLTQTGILSVQGTTSITSSAAVTDIDLSTHANNFAGAFRLLTPENIRDFSLRNDNPSARAITNLSDAAFLRNLYIKFDFAAYVVPLLEMELLNNITVIAGGEITQSSYIFSNGDASFTTGAFPITLNGNNFFGGAASFANTGTNDVSITAGFDLGLGTSNIGRDLIVVTGASASGIPANLHQHGVLTVGRNTTVTSVAPETDIDFSTQANDFAGTFTLVTPENVRDFALRNLHITAGAVVNLSSAGTTNLRDLIINYDFAAYVVPTLTMSTLRNVAITAGGAITQDVGGIDNSVTGGTASFTTGTFAITLTDANNNFGGAVSLANTGANDVSITAGFSLVLGTSDIGRDLFVVTGASGAGIPASLSQNGVLTVGRNTTVTSIAPESDIDLSTQANNLSGTVTIDNTAGAASNVRDFKLYNTNAAAGAVVNLSNTGTTNLRDLTIIYDNAAYVVPTLTMSTLRNVAITAGGAITQDVGGINNSVTGGTASFTTGNFAITLTDAGNDFGGVVTLTNTGANDVAITTANVLTLGTLSIAGGNLTAISTGAMDLGVGTVGGSLSANSNGGAITQTGALAIGGTSNINAGANSITLTDASNNFSGAVSLANTGVNDVAITDANVLTLGTLNITGGNLTAISTGAMNLGAGTVGGILSANSNDGAITQTGALVIVGTSDINAGANSITLTNASNDFGGAVSLANTGVFNVAITNGSGNGLLQLATVSAGQNFTATADAITLTSTVTTSISNAGAVRVTANAGLLTINAGADINSGGEVILSGDSGIVTAGNVTTANANVSFLSATTLTGNVAITTGAGAATGDILFDGEISGSSGGENLTVTASGNIQFNNTVGGTLATTQLGTFTVDCGNNFGNTITFGALASTVRAVDVKLNTNTLLATPATVATIVASGNITFSNTTFEMGHNHKLTGLGNITIGGLAAADATSVTLGDVNAVGNLSVTSSSIALLARASGSILTNTGGTVTDPTVDYVVGGQVFFSTAPVMVGSGGRAIFSNPTGNVDGSGTLGGFEQSLYSVPITAALLTGTTGQILDLSATNVVPPPPPPTNPVLNPANIIPPAMSSLASIGFLGDGDTLDSDETDDDLKTKKDSDKSSAKDKKSSSDTPTTAAPVSAGSR